MCCRGFIATTRPLTPRAAQALFPISCAPQAPVALPRCCRWLDHLVSVLLGEDHEVSLDRLPDIQTVPRGNHNLESALGFTQSLTHDGRRAVSTLPASPFSSRLATPERHFRFAFGCGPVLCRKTLRTPPRGDALSFGYSPPKWVGARGLAPPCPAGCQAYIGVGTGLYGPPLPPNRTCGSPAYGFPGEITPSLGRV